MRRVFIAALLLMAAQGLVAQSARDGAMQVSSHLVFVPALVQTPAKEVVYSLRPEDFLLTDKGVPQKVTLDDMAKQPLSLVVLMQTGGAAVREFDKYCGLETMLADMLGEAPNQVAIVNFDSRPEAASEFTSDIAQWKDAIDTPEPGNSGAAIRDAIKFSLGLLAKQPSNHRKVILLISQPQDSGSTTTAQEIARMATETGTSIYSLTFTPQLTRLKDAFKEPGKPATPWPVADGHYIVSFNLTEPLNMVLDAMKKNVASEIATLSGGEARRFGERNELDQTLAEISRDMRSQYLLSFTPQTKDVGFHPLRVSLIDHPEMSVSARTGYWLREEPRQ